MFKLSKTSDSNFFTWPYDYFTNGNYSLWTTSSMDTLSFEPLGETTTFNVPGCGPEDVNVEVKDNILTFRATHGKKTWAKTMTIDTDIDQDTIEATVKNGVLTITAKRKPELEPRKITVK